MPFVRFPRLLTSTLAGALLVASLTTAFPVPVAADGGSSFVSMANEHRADHGMGPVALHSAIDRIATERAVQISRAGGWYHDFDYLKRRFAELGICWSSFGEIIASNSTGSITTFGQQWMNSDGHRAIMLSEEYPFTHAGGSRHQAGDRWYAAMVFVQVCGAPPPPPPSPPIAGFTDIASSPFVDDIVWLVEQGITTGCAETRFCPRAAVLREQMASFLARAQQLPGTATDYFIDDSTSTHQPDINRIAAAGVTEGCGQARYCPRDTISRAEMASFLVRALGLPSASRDYFSDDTGSMHEDAINRLAAAGITTGCTTTAFCPTSVVTREQMAAFLHRGFN